MTRFNLLLASVFTLFAAANTCAGPVIFNGSLTGPIVNAGVPPGWSINSGTPDTNDIAHNVGGTIFAFYTPPSGPSPDGGTWVSFGNFIGFNESFGQTVSGFDIGRTYTVSWYHGNFGIDPSYSLPSSIELFVDSVRKGSGPTWGVGPGLVY